MQETYPDGKKKNVVRFFRTPCANYPIETQALGDLRFVSGSSNGKKYIYFASTLVGELDSVGNLDSLCFNSYAPRCDLVLGDDGSWTGNAVVKLSCP